MKEQDVKSLLEQIKLPYSEKNLIEAKTVKSISCGENRVDLNIELGFPANGYQDQLRSEIETVFADQQVVVQADISWSVKTHVSQPTLKALDSIKNIIAVSSAKGGVGKSTTATNLALALSALGGRVGLLDADIYGPSIPLMLDMKKEPQANDKKQIIPLENYGIQGISIGNLVDQDAPMVWRGPMVSRALQQLLGQTAWDNLDYLVIDLPPGTGDIQLTMSQKMPVTGAVIVTTPQEIALSDARKGIEMFQKVKIPVLGVVENMSLYQCSNCGHSEAIFGEEGGQQLADRYQVKLLGQMPLSIKIRQQSDLGKPIVASDPECESSRLYSKMALQVAVQIAEQNQSYKHKFPKIVIE